MQLPHALGNRLAGCRQAAGTHMTVLVHPQASPLLEGCQVGSPAQHLLLPAVKRRRRLLRAGGGSWAL